MTEVQTLCSIAKPAELLPTPHFIMSLNIVRANLLSNKAALQAAVDQMPNPVPLVMCVSVKTQPQQLLKVVKECGYLGEVITTAEMRASLDAG